MTEKTQTDGVLPFDLSAAIFQQAGGYAGYIWPAWSIAMLILLALAIISYRQMTGTEKRLHEISRPQEQSFGSQPQ